ncbi:MAG: uroporphyrinogen-III C-methyltransferase [Dehalococcoidia bacterium]|nr:uroporphyrinogen-III C-methyltransferase [Dehalococcoidia bacterium]MCB9485219.1 uroporphyrinogen-III C-methyltransferase [Thermoflexaceae bacterium]
MNQCNGKVILVGAGPGDPGLLTLAGAQAIAGADAIVYDALAPSATLRHARPGVELHYVGKRSGAHARQQTEINALLVDLASAGKRVVRLKGGDPFLFGRGAEEALACREGGIPFEVIPGISSALAAPAFAGIPLTHRQMAGDVLIVTGHEAGDAPSTDWAFAAQASTLVIVMGAASLAENMASLRAAGKPPGTPVACVRWGTRPDQQVVTGTVESIAGEVSRAGLTAPLATVVGPVAAFAHDLTWFEPGPLAGHRIVVTRARSDLSELAARLEALGAFITEAPAISIRPSGSKADLAAAVLERPDWIVFTSRHAVRAVIRSLRVYDSDVRSLSGIKLAAIGTATAEVLESTGIRPDFTPTRGTSEVLAAELPIQPGDRALLPLSTSSDNRLEALLAHRGAVLSRVTAYENVAEPLAEYQRSEVLEANIITFTSASTATNLRAALGDAPLSEGAKLVSIGPRTSEAVLRAFGRVDAQASTPSIEALIQAVLEVAT